MDPAKLKVVELRAELSKRGLDTKGNKAVLVEDVLVVVVASSQVRINTLSSHMSLTLRSPPSPRARPPWSTHVLFCANR